MPKKLMLIPLDRKNRLTGKRESSAKNAKRVGHAAIVVVF
jgi:hypothetical protein